jgi:tetratricopeptide (TPR) repeat protein
MRLMYDLQKSCAVLWVLYLMLEAADKLLKQAIQSRRESRVEDARRDFVLAVELCRSAGSASDLAVSLVHLGQIERDLHHTEASLQHYEEAAALCRVEGNPLRLAHTVRHIADIYCDEHQYTLAEPHYNEALAIYRSHDLTAPLALANAIRGLAILKQETGQFEPAKLLWQEARDLYSRVRVDAGVAECNARLDRLAG